MNLYLINKKMNKSLLLYLYFKLMLELIWYRFCSSVPCKIGAKALFPLLDYKCEGCCCFFFNYIGIAPLKSTETYWFTLAHDLAIDAYGCKAMCVIADFFIRIELYCRLVWEYFQKDSLTELFFFFFFFSFPSNQHFYSQYPFYKNKRWNPVPVDSILVLPFYSKILTLKSI